MAHWLQGKFESIKHDVEQGKNYKVIAAKLAASGLRTPTGTEVTNGDISDLLIRNGIRARTHSKVREVRHSTPASASKKDVAKAESLACEILQRKDLPRDLKKRLVSTILDGYANEF